MLFLSLNAFSDHMHFLQVRFLVIIMPVLKLLDIPFQALVRYSETLDPALCFLLL